MKIQVINKKLNQIKTDAEVVLVVNKKLKHRWISDRKFLDDQEFRGKVEEIMYLPHKKRIYIGVESLAHDNLRIAAAQAAQALRRKCRTIKIGSYIDEDQSESIQALTEGFILGSYSFDKYKSKPEKAKINRIIISTEDYGNKKVELATAVEATKRGGIIAQATNYTRDIVNQTPDEITPLKITAIAKELAKDNKFSFKVYGEDYLKKEGMRAFLAVSKASAYPPQLIHLIYKPEESRAKVALVGKGLTFDTGGLSLKPSQSMLNMKSDKSGASVILGIMQAVSQLKLPLEIHGIIGATENAIGKHAYKPGDVLTAKNNKTIEIKNTDAEGRLVLADCLLYAQEQKPDYVFDIATLTGSCIVALGEYTIGVMGHNQEFKDEIRAAGEKSGELTAELPFNRYLPKLLKSEVADIINVDLVLKGGAITAGLFLSEFIDKKYKDKWIHLDIAGPSFVEKPWGYNPYGASGAGVRLVTQWLTNVSN